METTRQQKIARMIQKDLSTMFQRNGQILYESALITVTKVHVSRDLAYAKIYLSLFATKDKHRLLDTIRHHAKDIRFHLGKDLHHQLRIIPELQFYEDDSLDYIENIDGLLRKQ
jgi:ribosome-binding factor A